MSAPRVLLVTGASSGFGLHIARLAGAAGHVVYAGLRDPARGQALAEATAGLDVRPLALDITSAAQREAAVARVLAEQGRLDALVNNAGVPMGGFVEQVDEDELRAVMEVNFFATVALTRAWLPTFRAQGQGHIINISSMAGRVSMPGLGAYAASKFALEGLTEALRQEMALWGVRVVNIQPGPYRTDIFGRNRAQARASSDPRGPWGRATARMEALVASSAARRMGDPEDVARAVLRVMGQRDPPFRVPMGPTAWLRVFLKDALPYRVMETVLRHVLRLEAGPRDS